MARIVRNCLQSILKLVNSLLGMVGIAIILYAVWLVRKWQEEMDDFPFDDTDHYHPAPWFIYAFLGLGVVLCVITCAGHVAAETVNGCCLYVYIGFIFLLLMLEGGVVADIFLNRSWEKDFPEDPSGTFHQFVEFIESNFELCKWIGLSVVCVQGVLVLLAMLLKACGPHRQYESDDEYDNAYAVVSTAPLLQGPHYPPPRPYAVGEPVYGEERWTVRSNERVRKEGTEAQSFV